MFKNHPKGLLAAALSNMGERFGYYIMNAVLVLFLCSKFGLSDEVSAIIYSVFYCGIYVLSLVGGIIADKSQKYKMTIMAGLIVMALGYVILSVPVLSTPDNIGWLLPVTCVALFLIAFGNGLFKGNLQAIVGQMYDNFEAEAALKGEERPARGEKPPRLGLPNLLRLHQHRRTRSSVCGAAAPRVVAQGKPHALQRRPPRALS